MFGIRIPKISIAIPLQDFNIDKTQYIIIVRFILNNTFYTERNICHVKKYRTNYT